jgi:HSP20 family protein
MLLTKFDPFREFESMQKVFNNYYPANFDKESSISAFTPSVNTREGEFAYHIDADLPGVNKEDIHIDIDQGKLTISGQREYKEEIKEEDYYKLESSFGKFQRTFSLPDNADTENITAKTDAGVLEVIIPKLEKNSNNKKIEVK